MLLNLNRLRRYFRCQLNTCIFLGLLSLHTALAKCPNWCSQHGICTGPDEDAFCICEMGYGGDDCGIRLCPKGDDPLSKDQGYRTIRLITGAVKGTLSGALEFTFNGESVALPANAAALDAASCGPLISSLANIGEAKCERGPLNEYFGAAYDISITAWPTIPWENNIYTHNGNPPLSSFGCDTSGVGEEAWAPYCNIENVVAYDVIENIECSGKGECDRVTATCRCSPGFKGPNCSDTTDKDDVAVHIADGPFFTGTVLKLRTLRPPSPEFNIVEAISGASTLFSVSGEGNMNVAGGIRTSSVAVSDIEVVHTSLESPAASVVASAPGYTGTALEVAIESPRPEAKLLQLKSGNSVVLSVGSADEGAVFSGAGGITVDKGSLVVAGSITSTSSITSAESISAPTLIASGAGLSAITNSIDTPAATLSASSLNFNSELLSLKLPSLSGENKSVAFIKAEVDGVEKFVLAADGAVTIRSGGLAVESGGLNVASGGLKVGSGGVSVEGGLQLLSGALKLPAEAQLVLDGGGLLAETGATTTPAVEAIASSTSFGGTVLKVKGPATTASSYMLINGEAGTDSVFTVDAKGNIDSSGKLSTKGTVTAGGSLIAGGAAILTPISISAGNIIDLSSSKEPQGNEKKTSFWTVKDDGETASNVVILPPAHDTAPGQLLMLHNGDAHALKLQKGSMNVPAGYTLLLINDGSQWRDVRALDAHISELLDITKFIAANDIDIGNVAFKAGALVAAGNMEGGIATYGAGGLLTSAQGVKWDSEISTLTVPKLKVGEMAGGLDLRGLPLKNAVLTNSTIDNLGFLKVNRLMLLGEALPEKSIIPNGVRLVAMDSKGEFVSGGEYFELADGKAKARHLHASTLTIDALGSDVDCSGHTLNHATLADVKALTGLESLTVSNGLKDMSLASFTGALAMIGEGGSITSAQGLTYSEGGQLTLEKISTSSLTAGSAELGRTVMTAALDLAGMPLLNVRPQDLTGASLKELPELTVRGDLKLAGRDTAKGRLLQFGQDGAIVATQADRLEIECTSLAAGKITGASISLTAGITASTIEADSMTAKRIQTSNLQLEGDMDGGGRKISNVLLDRATLTGVRSLEVDGELRMSDFSGGGSEGTVVIVGPSGRLQLASPTGSLKWRNGIFEVPKLSGHAIVGNVDLSGFTLSGASVDIADGGSLTGVQDLAIGADLRVKGDGAVGGALSVGESVFAGGPYMESSDERLKQHIEPLNSSIALDALMRLRGVTYAWREESGKHQHGRREVGFLAQEVEDILPDIVSEDSEGFLTVAYSRLSPLLVEGVKALVLENESLKSQLSDMEKRVATLEKMMLELMQNQQPAPT